MKKRAEIIISGRVQRAGFRDFVDEQSFDLLINGFVKNLDDGTVELICEGEEENIKRLLERINIIEYPIRVDGIDVVYKEPAGEYNEFEIIREEDMRAATFERMDSAVRYIRKMNSDIVLKLEDLTDHVDSVGEKVDLVGSKVDRVGEKVDLVGSKVDLVGEKVDMNRQEISSEVRLNRDDFRSHLDERISSLEHELAQIKAKMMS